ncbi:isocitrate lyase/PEP mutase family protein [Sediminicoccus rosea]|jgi:2-methylisocitrate lyase-like PEP mutase family enzyme|uniref:Isocitrate lyase/PEP mutase family protein n=1 Tax=Sediminicoccus rosea TaxID=1225128 RepID=A0ABZ0PFL9_9PROT|nr:isocitrate lyase/PEP mutase family protein [Sediminicoccus rosea]WPB83980.1 isocitrate lyase/PEP mutase family protein [Sediminicoccus rosea]
MANPSLKAAFDAKKFIVAPGIFDMISTRVADGMGFDCLYATGFGTVASHLGVADAGIATYTDMVGRMGRFAQMAKTPIIADADTGYGGLLNVRHTVMGYEAAGISGIQLEDQEMPKKCGHTPGRSVIPAEDMVLKLKVAVEARRDPNFLIVARTDARTSLGLEEAIRRGRMYGDAGADIVFIESPETEAEMVEIGRSINKPLLANNVEGGRTPILPAARLKEIGYSIAIYPGAGFLAVSAALERVYSHLLKNGDTNGLPAQESYGFGRMCELMGFPEVWEFDKKWARKD